jgi:RNA polymerase sigma factor (sigma-70 family)
MPENGKLDPAQDMERLLGDVCAGSQDAARELVDKYGEEVLRTIRGRMGAPLRTHYDSDDFVQAVWASFFAAPLQHCRFETPADLQAYLVAMASNKVCSAARNAFHAKKRNLNRTHSLDGSAAILAEQMTGREPTPSQLVVAKEQWDRLLQGQQAVHRCILQLLRRGFSPEETARELDVSVKTVRRVMEQALNRLRAEGTK